MTAPNVTRRKLPLGIQTFREIREDDCYYVDKKLEPDGAALAQLQARGYADKYRASGEPIHLLGVEFSRATRTLAAFEVARA